MANCPVCNSEVKEKSKFCSQCGVQLTDAPSERAWIVAMQERIKAARHNDWIYNVIAVVGILLATIIPFVMRYVLLLTMTMTGWLITAAGIVLFLVSIISMWFDNRKVKELIEQLENGQEEEEEQEDEDGEEGEEEE
jgi:uncharacterized membrane protein YvbJ